jgi:DNA-binding NarL/FixJ family response regulator
VGGDVTGDVPGPIRVVIVDDDALVRAGLAMILGGTNGIEIVGQAENGLQGLALVERQRPQVVLMDIRMPRMDGLEATNRLMAMAEPPAVIVLTTFDADDYVLRALRSGATGFLMKDTAPADIVDAVHRVAAGEHMLSPSVTATLVKRIADTSTSSEAERRSAARARLDVLSEREHEVAVAVGAGKANADIAEELYLSVATVKAYVSRILSKLGAANRVQIAICVHDANLG